MANVSRVAAWWREVDWRTVAAYSATAVPGAALGARTLLALPMGWVEGLLGLFFVAMVPVRRWMQRQHWQLHRGHMAAVGAVIGFLTGVVVSTGPLNTPFFLMHGLVRGPFLATEAMSSVPVYLAKALTFRSLGALPLQALVQGLIVGSSLMAGAFIARRVVRHMAPERFRTLMDVLLLAAGLGMLGAALTRTD